MTVRILDVQGRVVAGEAVDLTPEGMGIAILDGDANFSAGDEVVVEHVGVALSGHRHRALVSHVTDGRFGGRLVPRVGVSFVRERASPGTRDQRKAERYGCRDDLPVVASALSTVFFRDWMQFRIKELGAGGATLSTSLRNKGLLPGMELSFTVMLPMNGPFTERGRIVSVFREGSDRDLRLGLQWVDPSSSFLNAVAEYLLIVDKRLTPSGLRSGGLELGSIERAVTYDYATREDYETVLSLRLRAHQAEGRFEDHTTANVAASFDAHSRHLVARFGDRIVGYVRLIYVDGETSKSQYVTTGGHEVPEWLWREGFVEAGAGAVDPEFQRAGLFLPLMQHAVRVGLQSGYRYMLGACNDDLLDMYRQMGFERIESRTASPKPGWVFTSHLIVIDMANLLTCSPRGKFVRAMAEAARFARVR